MGSILITTRDKSLLGEFPGQSLATASPADDAIELLMILTNQEVGTLLHVHLEKEMTTAAKLIKVVDCPRR